MIWQLLSRAILPFARYRARRQFDDFVRRTQCVRQTQEALLLEKVRRNASSRFGKEHHFDQIHDVASFRGCLPIADYEYYAPYIEQVKRGDLGAMFGPGQQVLQFALTSGSTGATKFIPITAHYLEEYKRSWLRWSLRTYLDHPNIVAGSILSLSGDREEFRAPSGVPCGSVSGLVASVQSRVARLIYVLPESIMKIKDVRAKYYCAMRLAAARRNVTLLVAANPATLIGAARLTDELKETLVRDIWDGTLTSPGPVPSDVEADLTRRVRRPDPRRACELEAIIARTGSLLPKDYWPDLDLVANWIGGTMGAYLRHYPRLFGDVAVRDHGLTASEGRMTMPVNDHDPAGVLDIMTNFFEFIPEEEGESPTPTVLLADELQEGRKYYILPTTSSGLYRYHIGDVVRCTGFMNQAPLLEFLNKGCRFSSVTGEKLAEAQVVGAVQRGLERLNLAIGDFTLAPCWDDPPYYVLLVEENDLGESEMRVRMAEEVDHHLSILNCEYRSRRESMRLGPVVIRVLPAGTWERFRRERLRQTAGAEQYKHPCLTGDLDFAGRLVPTGASPRSAKKLGTTT